MIGTYLVSILSIDYMRMPQRPSSGEGVVICHDTLQRGTWTGDLKGTSGPSMALLTWWRV